MNLQRISSTIARLHKSILQRGKLDVHDAVEIGRLLSEAKKRCRRNYKWWIANNCAFSYAQSTRYTRLYQFSKGCSLQPFTSLAEAYAAAGIVKPTLEQYHEIRERRSRRYANEVAAYRKQIERTPPPRGRYRTIVIDPPWPIAPPPRWQQIRTSLAYPTMTLKEIAALPVDTMVEPDCHMYLWATHSFLPEAFDLLKQWGFEYSCMLTWIKSRGVCVFNGWQRSTEHCLFAYKGNLKLLRTGVRVDFEAEIREHSRKPDEFYELVKKVSPGPRLEMFAREARDGFSAWGNEVGRFVGVAVG